MFTPVLNVCDVEMSLAFYTRVLGFEGSGGLPGMDGGIVYAEATMGDARLMLTRRSAALNRFSVATCGIELYLTLPDRLDIQQYHNQLRAKAVNIIVNLHDELWGDRAFTITDPDGYHLIIAQPVRYAVSAPMVHKHIA